MTLGATRTCQTQAMPPSTAALLERVRQQVLRGEPEWTSSTAPEAFLPLVSYFDPDIWQSEISSLFRKLPLIAAHSSEIGPGQVLPHDGYGLPLLLSRDAQGEVRCFLNVCRHRGMRLVETPGAQPKSSVVCRYHGWAFQLDGQLRHRLHASAFDSCKPDALNLVSLPCAERHGLIWVVPDPNASIDLDTFLGTLNTELPFFEIEKLTHFRTIETEFNANWKLMIDAFTEGYHIRVLHKDSIAPFFTDNMAAAEFVGPHIHSLVARKAAETWAKDANCEPPAKLAALGKLATVSQIIFPNTITIFHPDYLSLVTLYPTGPETMRWTHRMLIPPEKATPDWAPHWEKTFNLIERGVFQAEDIACAVGIQQGLKSGANTHSRVGRLEQSLVAFHGHVQAATGQKQRTVFTEPH